MKTLILTEGSKKIGFGHVSRCIAIIQGLQESGSDIELMINGDKVISSIIPRGIKFQISNWIDQLNNINFKRYDLVIVDSYISPIECYNRIQTQTNLACLDDYNRLHYPCNILINGSLGAENNNYDYPRQVKLLLGTNYTPLRKPFWHHSRKIIRNEINEILVTFGGEDVMNLSPRIALLLLSKQIGRKINVIVGAAYSKSTIKKLKTINNIHLLYDLNQEQMKDVMISADIAISAGGQTIYELAKMGVPSIIIATANNQERNIEEWINTGIINKEKMYVNGDLESRLLTNIDNIQKRNIRQKISLEAQTIMRRNGVKNIVKKMYEYT